LATKSRKESASNIQLQSDKIQIMYLFFDTETTGLPKSWKAPVTDVDNWPRLVQLAILMYDSSGKEIAAEDFIIKPAGFSIPPSASKIHGITTERALQEGQPVLSVLKRFNTLVQQADCLVAHNMSFDEKIVAAEFLRNGMTNTLSGKNKICTMERTTNFCAINGQRGYKWPKLAELHYKLFGTDFQEAHNAAADIQATAKCFWELKRIGEFH
jgi:DNA polymerase III epsilon subunit-like protein